MYDEAGRRDDARHRYELGCRSGDAAACDRIRQR
jgi:hypothetical protein